MQNNFSNNSKNTIVQRWSPEALDELSRVPGFVRGKVKRNVEKFADVNQLATISLETMYAAKEAANA